MKEDRQTNTLDGAAAYERARSEADDMGRAVPPPPLPPPGPWAGLPLDEWERRWDASVERFKAETRRLQGGEP